MPYIQPEDYERAQKAPETPGELNFAITHLIIGYLMDEHGRFTLRDRVRYLVFTYIERVGMSYTNANAVMGVLDCSIREMDRRVIPSKPGEHRPMELNTVKLIMAGIADEFYEMRLTPYEDIKVTENGDVYPSVLTKP